jgi:hypothetical protein
MTTSISSTGEGSSKGRRSVRGWKRFALAGLLATGVAGAGAAVMPAGTAAASSRAWVYVSMPTWQGNCPRGGSVKYLNVSTWGSITDNRADAGDDMVYISTAMNENTTLVAQGLCYNGSATYYGPAVSVTIRATRQNQTFWVGPGRVASN